MTAAARFRFGGAGESICRDVGASVLRRSLVVLAVAIAVLLGQYPPGRPADSAILGSTSHSPSGQAPGGPFAVVIVVDAARYDEFDLSHMPNLAALAAHGTQYSRAWVGQLPSVTETSHATIGTGMLPKHHLILGDTWRVPGTNQMSPNLLNGTLVRTGYIGKLLQQTKVPTLATEIRGKYPGSLVVSLSAHKAYAADAMGAGAADFVGFGGTDSRGHFVPGGVPGHVPAPAILQSPQLDLKAYPRVPGLEDDWTTTFALKFLFKYHPRVLMINLPEVDVTGHAAGTDPAIMQPLMTAVDHDIGRIVAAYQRAKMYDKTYFIVTSDHGMVPAARTVQDEQIHATVVKAGGVPLYIGHGDYSPIWLKNPGYAPTVGVALSNANIPNVAAVYVRFPKSGYRLMSPSARLADPAVASSYAHLLATFDSAEAPDVVLLYDENTMTMKPGYLTIGRKGDHGGATWGAQHIGLFIAGPNVKPGFTSPYPARLVDIAPTIEMFMGITGQGQDGVPLADALAKAPDWALKQQKAVQPGLTKDVDAIVHEALLRPNPR